MNKLVHQESIPGIRIVEIPPKGRGLIALRHFEKGTVLCFYEGDLKTQAEGLQKETEQKLGGNYMFYFTLNSKKYCVDATEDRGQYGRFINHSITEENLKPAATFLNGTPQIYFVCKKDIEAGSEFLYDYGERRKNVLQKETFLTE